ncbi:MAG: peptidylprolyl isomerase [Bacteroidales bacterium]|jgi:peptidyl-prolyl cis-trans isomerase SurA|nr:peptidylprolyl isomerase [Bacteroidales bacterium]
MKRGSRILLILACMIISGASVLKSQVLVESVAAIVGNEVIYLSEIENMIVDLRSNGNRAPVEVLRCNVLEELLISKLFLDQARIDSIIVGDDEVEGELTMKMNDAIRRAGSEKNLEEYFKKGLAEIRKDIRKALVQQEVIRQVQGSIAENIKLTPNELKKFFSNIPKDSLPIIPAKVEVSIIQLDPPENEENKAEARQKLLDIRSQILAGKSFNVLAIMYSEDPGTATSGGELGYLTRGELEKPYADAAFSLTKNTVSKIVETRYGFHIIQLIDRNGDLLNTRHILIKSKVKPDQVTAAMAKLDSISDLIRKDSLKFAYAALRFSTHKDSRINGGKMVSSDPSERDTWFTLEELNPEMYVKVRELKVGEISEPFRTTDENNNTVFRVVKLDNEIPAHRANLKDDYQNLSNTALMNKRNKTYEDWIKKKIESTYIKVSDELISCDFLKKNGWLK